MGNNFLSASLFCIAAIWMAGVINGFSNTTTRLVGPSAGSNSVILEVSSGVAWTATTSVPWLHVLPGYGSGSGSTNVIFSYDANPDVTRSGNVSAGGKTVVVTQAGTNYIQAPGPLTGLVTNGINAPYGIGIDSGGNVYFSDSANGAIKRWNQASNTISTLVSGLSSPYGLAVDKSNNVYVAQFGSGVIRKYSTATGNSTVFTNNTTGVAGLAVDGANNIYITVPSQRSVKLWNASTSTLTTYTTNGLISPWGVAVDSSGDLYASDIGDDTVKKYSSAINLWIPIVSSIYLSNPYNLAVDDGGNIYVADYSHGAVKKWSAASTNVTTVVSGLVTPIGVAIDGSGNLFISDWGGDAVRELPYAFVDSNPKTEPATAGSDSLSVVLPSGQNLQTPFAPTVSLPWLNIANTNAGVVTFNFTTNLSTTTRTGSITLFGQNIVVNQSGILRPKIIKVNSVSQGVIQMGFTNGLQGIPYTVLFSTNCALPMTNWSVIGTATNNGFGVWQFNDNSATNGSRFYMIRSP